MVTRVDKHWPLLDRLRWWLWVARPRAGSSRPRKVPVRVGLGGRLIPHDAKDERAWRPWSAVRADYLAGLGDGVGVALGDGLSCLDIDECLDASGAPDTFTSGLLAELDAYAERSPSGGLHILGWVGAGLPLGNRRVGRVELLRTGLITVTGDVLPDRSPDPAPSTALDALWSQLAGPPRAVPSRPVPASSPVSPANLLATASRLRNADRFLALWYGDTASYPSPSEADFSLCRHLHFLLGADADAIDAAFRCSALYAQRPGNWHRRAASGPPPQTYGQLTVRRAIACGGPTLTHHKGHL